jgi:hypothetical protein
VAQVVGRSGVRAAARPLRLGGDIPQGRPAATMTAIVTALETVTPGAGTESGTVLAGTTLRMTWPDRPI